MKRHVGAVFAAATLLAGLALAVGDAQAAKSIAPPATLASIDPSGFTLDPGDSFSRLSALVSQLSADPRIHATTLDALLAANSPEHSGTWPLCHSTNLSSTYEPHGFCWDKTDDTTTDWYPQGISGSGDAQASGTVDGKRLVAASWHTNGDTLARVTIADYSKPSAGVPYTHLLLVKPVVKDGKANFTNMGSVNDPGDIKTHADGLMWFGNLLFVANGRQLQVYSLANIWKMQTTGSDAGDVGLTANGAFAHYSAYAIPMIGEYDTTPTPGTACASVTGRAPCLNSISLSPDRTSFITAEYYHPAAPGGRLIQWPLDASTGLPSANAGSNTQATEAFSSPIQHMQGAATDGTSFYLAGDCTNGAPESNTGCILKATPNQAPAIFTKAPPYLENLSYWPVAGELWGINEAHSTSGERVVFKILPNK